MIIFSCQNHIHIGLAVQGQDYDHSRNDDRSVSTPAFGNCSLFLRNRALWQIYWHLTDVLWPKDN